jgi:hypothetical protein
MNELLDKVAKAREGLIRNSAVPEASWQESQNRMIRRKRILLIAPNGLGDR